MNTGVLQLGQPALYPSRTKASVYEFTYTSEPPDAQGANGVYIWTPPVDCTWVEFLLIGGGGGGSSGARRALGVSRSGGGTAAAGAHTWTYVPRVWLTSPLTLTIGAGGAGGASVTVDNTANNIGTAGGVTSVSMNGVILLSAGGGRVPTTATGGGSGTAGSSTLASNGFAGGAGGATAAAPSGGQFYSVGGGYQPQQGGSGGGADATNVYQVGGSPPIRNFIGVYDYARHIATLSSGLTTFKSGGDAGNNVAGGNGADGLSFGAAGGGGGASNNGYASGKGGNGASGYVRVSCL